MRLYGVLWQAGCVVAVAPLCLLGLVNGPAISFLVVGLAVGAFVAMVDETRAWWAEAGVFTIVTCATIEAIGALALPLSLVVLVTSPCFWDRVGGRHKATTARPTPAAEASAQAQDEVTDTGPTLPAEAFVSPVAALDDGELSSAWVRSWWALSRARSVRSRLQLVLLRQAYLDEMHRRAPEHFDRWIAESARANSNPGRDLFRHKPQQGEAA